jgi:hypothetical protein
MIELMDGFPEDVLAIRAKGHVDARDYRETLVPEALRRIELHRALRLLYQLGPEFEGMTAGAMWADATLGLAHWGDFGRIAVVTDVAWIANAARLFAPFLRPPLRVFGNAALDEARRWIVQPAD